jgi:hypothetical protein
MMGRPKSSRNESSYSMQCYAIQGLEGFVFQFIGNYKYQEFTVITPTTDLSEFDREFLNDIVNFSYMMRDAYDKGLRQVDPYRSDTVKRIKEEVDKV